MLLIFFGKKIQKNLLIISQKNEEIDTLECINNKKRSSYHLYYFKNFRRTFSFFILFFLKAVFFKLLNGLSNFKMEMNRRTANFFRVILYNYLKILQFRVLVAHFKRLYWKSPL